MPIQSTSTAPSTPESTLLTEGAVKAVVDFYVRNQQALRRAEQTFSTNPTDELSKLLKAMAAIEKAVDLGTRLSPHETADYTSQIVNTSTTLNYAINRLARSKAATDFIDDLTDIKKEYDTKVQRGWDNYIGPNASLLNPTILSLHKQKRAAITSAAPAP